MTLEHLKTSHLKQKQGRSLSPNGFTTGLYRKFKELKPMLLKLLHKTKKEIILPIIFMNTKTQIPKLDK